MPQRKRKKISLSDLHEETPLQKKMERERDRGRERALHCSLRKKASKEMCPKPHLRLAKRMSPLLCLVFE
jgi:hypothetical protein